MHDSTSAPVLDAAAVVPASSEPSAHVKPNTNGDEPATDSALVLETAAVVPAKSQPKANLKDPSKIYGSSNLADVNAKTNDDEPSFDNHLLETAQILSLNLLMIIP